LDLFPPLLLVMGKIKENRDYLDEDLDMILETVRV